MNKVIAGLLCLLVVILLFCTVFFSCFPAGRALWNSWFFAVQKADDATAYNSRKLVEDTCRAMIASYISDSLIYQQYKDSNSEEKLSWAEQAKMRANKTAASYNEYVLKNSFIWNGNVPADIRVSLPFLD